MPLIVCLLCDRQREVFRVQSGMVCANCGVGDPRIVRDRRIWSDWEPKDGLPKIEAQRRTLAGLKWIQDNKGHKKGFPVAKFKDIFGDWPPREIEAVPPEAPTASLLRRIAWDNMRWKKQRRAEEKAEPKVVAQFPIPPEGLPSFMNADDWAVKL